MSDICYVIVCPDLERTLGIFLLKRVTVWFKSEPNHLPLAGWLIPKMWNLSLVNLVTCQITIAQLSEAFPGKIQTKCCTYLISIGNLAENFVFYEYYYGYQAYDYGLFRNFPQFSAAAAREAAAFCILQNLRVEKKPPWAKVEMVWGYILNWFYRLDLQSFCFLCLNWFVDSVY